MANPSPIEQLQPRAFGVGIVALLVAIVAGAMNPARFFPAYLYAFLFWMGVPIGCLCLLQIQHLTGGRWGKVIRRCLEAGTRTLPLMAVLFVPLLLGLRHLYIWAVFSAAPDTIKDDGLHALLLHKHLYLNPSFFAGRAVFFFGVWLTLAFFLNRWSTILDDGPDARIYGRLQALSGAGLLLMVLTISFSSIDWAMSLDPRWQSTIYGILFAVGDVLSAFALVILIVTMLCKEEPLRTALDTETSHDLGKLLLAFVMLWAYVHLSQFLIVWSANLPEEIPWYMKRMAGVWGGLAVAVIIFQFVLPFPMLLSRGLKRNPSALGRVAIIILAGRLCDLFWIVGPAFGPAVSGPHWMDLLTLLGLGGLWLGSFARELSRRPLLPQNDPEFVYGHSA